MADDDHRFLGVQVTFFERERLADAYARGLATEEVLAPVARRPPPTMVIPLGSDIPRW